MSQTMFCCYFRSTKLFAIGLQDRLSEAMEPVATLPRRDFLRQSALAVAATTAAAHLTALAAPGEKRMIGMQVGAVSFVDEGTDRVLEILQERGGVNTIFLTTFTYGRGLAGRQVPGQPFPDHGVRESDEKFFHGGNYATPHREYYEKTLLKGTRAPDHGDQDIVA